MNELDLRESIKAELSNNKTSPLVEEKLYAAYEQVRRMPEVKGGGRRYRQEERIWLKPMKAAAGVLGTIAAAFVILLGVCFANPALAAELPLIGGIFAKFIGKTASEMPPSVNSTVIANAVPVDDNPTNDETSDVQIEVAEASCDGMTINLALRMTCMNETVNSMDTTLSESYDMGGQFFVTANGVKLGTSFAYHPVFEMTETPGIFTGVLPFTLPNELRDAKTLNIHCEVPSLRAASFPKDAAEKLPGEAQIRRLSANWKSDFTIEVIPDFKTYTPNAEIGSVILEKVVVGEASIEYTVTMPVEMNTQAILNPLDDRGEDFEALRRSRTNGGVYMDDKIKTMVVHISAPEYDTKTLTFRVANLDVAVDEVVLPEDLEAAELFTYTLELD